MSSAPELDDVLIYSRSKAGRAEGKHGDFFQIGAMVFNSRDAAMSAAEDAARKRRVSIWMIEPGAAAQLLRTYRATKR